ncbi:RNA-binding S4 domain-containing protein [Paludibacter sp. 221]|uniref:RNA-binding S4 domain-containing protein n=1 Tax=Paludibacter sp. 221 TaxID=2302939 RepID=UPI0013D7581A|nr:RNA-binding S4 domain-containing protein [Paludibacter sp. 221]NDV45763.1 RNA-binding S4 domain-containing protein [Paludibacter sp. 221]
MKTEVRIDKWLWAVRLFKTRSLAAEACKKGKVFIAGVAVKPSRNVKVGDVIQIRKNPVMYSFEVLALSENRMNAKLVPGFMRDVTTPDQLELIELGKLAGNVSRARGTGRPTKKERRDLDDFVAPHYIDEDFDWDFDDE